MILGPTSSPVKRGTKPGPNPTPKALAGRALRERRLAAGLCAECGKEDLDGRYLGKRCKARKRKWCKPYKRMLRDSGICTGCQKAQATGSGVCDACYAKWKPQKYANMGLAPPKNPGRVRKVPAAARAEGA